MNRFLRFLIISLVAVAPAAATAQSEKYLALTDSANNYLKRERWADAERAILEALRLEPANFTNALLLSNLGVARSQMGRHDEALEDFRLALSISPNSTTVRNNRARTLLTARRYVEALQDLNESIEIDSTQTWARQMRGLLLLQAGLPEAAHSDFKRLYQENPDNHTVLTGLAQSAQAKGDNEEALRFYDLAIQCEDVAETRFSRIMLKLNMERYSDAADDIRTAMEAHPQSPDFFVARARLNRLTYRYADAETDKKIALDKGADPQFVEQYVPKNGR